MAALIAGRGGKPTLGSLNSLGARQAAGLAPAANRAQDGAEIRPAQNDAGQSGGSLPKEIEARTAPSVETAQGDRATVGTDATTATNVRTVAAIAAQGGSGSAGLDQTKAVDLSATTMQAAVAAEAGQRAVEQALAARTQMETKEAGRTLAASTLETPTATIIASAAGEAAAAEDAPTAAVPAPEPPTATPVPEPQFTVEQNANVRGGPGTLYPVIGGLRPGETYRVAAKSPDGAWLQFQYGGAAGWVSAGLVTMAGDFGRVQVAAVIPPPPPTPTRTPTPKPTLAPPAIPGDPMVADLVARINKARADAGLNQLRWSPELGQAAGAHTWDMASHGFFSHTGSDGSDVTVRMRRAGYTPLYWGEILTHVNMGGGPDAAFGMYWGSQHHHDIILGDKFTEIGAAWTKDPGDGSFNYWAVVFGRR